MLTEEERKLERKIYLQEYARKRKEENPDWRKVYLKKYFENNKEDIKARQKIYASKTLNAHNSRQKKYYLKWREEHPLEEKVKKTPLEIKIMKHNIAKRYYNKHKEIIRKNASQWAVDNHQKCALYCAKRRSLKLKNGTFKITDRDVFRQLNRQHNKCFWCGKKLVEYNMDHVIPLSKGGTHSIGNIVISCPECNKIKSDRLPIVFKILNNISNCKSNS